MPYVSSSSSAGLRPTRQRLPAHPIHEAADDEFSTPVYRPPPEPIDWVRLGFFGLGIALGALLGSGTALLLAPESGQETRARLRRRARRLRGTAGDAWDDLRDELEWAARRGRKRVRRGMTRGGWMAEDAVDAGRRRLGLR
jgi:hypothetical protein